MPEDPYRAIIRQRQFEIALRALMREEAVANYFRSRGYQVLSEDDDQTRQLFGIPKSSKAADIVAQVSDGHIIIAEVKGSNIDDAIAQLESTVAVARPRYMHIACKIFAGNPAPSTDTVDLRGGSFGYKARSIFHRGFPGEWLLMAYQPDGSTQFVRIGSEVVSVIFGPHV